MTRTTRHCITALLSLAGLVGFVGVSAALEGEDPSLEDVETPCPEDPATEEATDEGTADDSCDVPVDDTTDDDTTTEDDVVDDTTTTTEDTVPDDALEDTEDPESAPVDNHGAAVSTAAHECPPGPEHGPCVREVARSNGGKPTVEDDGTVDEDVTTTSDEAAAKGKGKGQSKKEG